MAHWIIIDHGFGGQDYRCSNCRSSWNDLLNNPRQWDKCPHCGAKINEEEDVYESDLVHRQLAKMKQLCNLVELGEDIKPDEPINLENRKNIVILSLEKYDQMKADFEQCIEERDRELWKTEQELRGLQELVKALGITPEVAANVYPDTVTVDLCENPINCTKRYVIKFDVRR